MKMKMSRREKQFLVAGVLAVFAYVGIVYVIEPFIQSQSEVREKIQGIRIILERHRALSSEKDRFQRKVDDLRNRIREAEVLLLEGETAPLVAAKVQEFAHRFGEETNLGIIQENVLRPRQRETLVEVPVELSLRGNLQGVRDFLYRVQTAENLLTVPKLVIRSTPSKSGSLSVDLQVSGYMRREEKG